MSSEKKGTLTECGELLRSPDSVVRNQAVEKIYAAYAGDLLRMIRHRIGQDLGGRVGSEDVLQSAFCDFVQRPGAFPNRNAMFGCLVKIVLGKLANAAKHHRRQKRDVGLEEHQVGGAFDDSSNGPDILERGRKFVPMGPSARPYHRAGPCGKLERGSDDSFFDDDILDLMIQEATPDQAANVIDLLEILKDHDRRDDDCLVQVFTGLMEGRGTSEIADDIGMARRTVERKRHLIEDLLSMSKCVRLRMDDPAMRVRTVYVSAADTASDLLRRLDLNHTDFQLVRHDDPMQGFEPKARIYRDIEEDDELLVCRK
jgi:DNA-directed RNA polymerase specialized sigma24 family protein